MKAKELLKILKKEGWKIGRVTGSHHIMVKEGKRPIPIPVHGSKDVKKGLLSAIFRQAGIKKKR